MTGHRRTTCAYCGVGCGLIVEQRENGRVQVAADPDHPANFGRICLKGASLGESLSTARRATVPRVFGESVSWDHAAATVADRFRATIKNHGPESVAFYVSGQLLTEDYYVANKLMKGFIGAANIDTNSRLCMSSSVSAMSRAFGSDTVPGCYEDLEAADLIVLVGSNAAWCHPVLFQRFYDPHRANNPNMVVIDPRRTETATKADLHLSLRPGSDAALFNGLLHHLRKSDKLDFQFLEEHTRGFSATLTAAQPFSIPHTASECGVPEKDIARFFNLFARTPKVVTLFSQGVNQSSSGTDKVNAVLNCHLATGRIGKPGMGPFSLTGQGNAMGGREVGGLSTVLAAHMSFTPEDCDRVERFWHAPSLARKPGLKAVELFEAIHRGEVRALWVMCTNPAVSLPNSERVHEALQRIPFLVVSECEAETETTRFADVHLPAQTWGEKNGTVTNSERRISRRRAFLEPPGEARPDWWIISRVACEMGFMQAFSYTGPADIFREHAALSGFENTTRDFDISALAELSNREYEDLAPIQWPVNARYPRGRARLFETGRFFHNDTRARMIPIQPRPPKNPVCDTFPFALNTGRVRDQWHSMSRTGKVPRLFGHTPEPMLAIHPEDAAANGLDQNPSGLVMVRSKWGGLVARIAPTRDQPRGTLFLPFHWNGRFAQAARANRLVNPATDPLSGQPELKHTPVAVTVLVPRWFGFLLTQEQEVPPINDLCYQVSVPRQGFWRHELAGTRPIQDYARWLEKHWGLRPREENWLEYAVGGGGSYRAAQIVEGRLNTCFYLTEKAVLPDRTWLETVFAKKQLEARERRSLLAGSLI
ncbi:molybdopterin oxidoreductase family protein [Acanthopleuribacter pedis]|uniref:Nitrate reductase n=1 Tax=Acanthopleuribacter pedis TaxID=442870 RepID=A0A8J7U4W1_9BACT|nr:nitrate reductase [Acanthopleuribacter pedis]MBO1321873.1 nitrate reductase [Acanthopleuribacter pedis]